MNPLILSYCGPVWFGVPFSRSPLQFFFPISTLPSQPRRHRTRWSATGSCVFGCVVSGTRAGAPWTTAVGQPRNLNWLTMIRFPGLKEVVANDNNDSPIRHLGKLRIGHLMLDSTDQPGRLEARRPASPQAHTLCPRFSKTFFWRFLQRPIEPVAKQHSIRKHPGKGTEPVDPLIRGG